MLSEQSTAKEQDQLLEQAIQKDESRLRRFIRRQIGNSDDSEDILQEVFCELLEAYRLMKPIEQVSAWLFRVARNRITDRFRKKKPELLEDRASTNEEGEGLLIEEVLASGSDGPEQLLIRKLILEGIEDALEELPEEQREVFVAHEIEGDSFKEISLRTGVSVNTLLSRKRYAVLYLREQLRELFEEIRNT